MSDKQTEAAIVDASAPVPQATDLCAWCGATYGEHSGPVQEGCESFVPIDWRHRAHILLDALIDGGAKFSPLEIYDELWALETLRLRRAIIRAREYRGKR